MTRSSRPWRFRSAVGVVPLAVTAVLLAGCSDSGETDPSPSPTSTGAEAEAAATVETLIATGITQAQGGDTAAARTTFSNVLTIDPGNKFAYFNLGIIATMEGSVEDAIANYDKALETDPSYTPAMFNRAILLEPTDPDAALAVYEQIVSIAPNSSTAFLRMSFLLEAKGETDKAAQARESALALDPSLSTVENPNATPAPTEGP
jgi:Tfp pilus assembly protein PilF